MRRILQRVLPLILISTAFFFMAGCDKSKLVSSWADPEAASYQFSKPMVVAVIDDEQLRETAEEAIVRNIKSVQAFPSYIVLHEGEMDDVESTKKRLLNDGYDGAVVMRLLDVEDRTEYVATAYPNYYYDYWSYYRTSWAAATYSQSYIRKDRIIKLETTLFSITDNKLLWVGVSESNNPESVSSLIDEIAEVIGKELRKKGIVPKTP